MKVQRFESGLGIKSFKGIWMYMWAGVVVLAFAASGQGAVDSDDFEDGNDDGWTRYAPLNLVGGSSDFSVVAGKYAISSDPSPDAPIYGPARAGSYRAGVSYTNSQVAVDVSNWGTVNDSAFGLLARLSNIGLGTTDGYAMTYSVFSQDITIVRIDNEGATNLADVVVPFDPGLSYRLTFDLVGSQLTGRAYLATDLSNPLAEVTFSDSTYGSGYNGLVVFDNTNRFVDSNGAFASFDNYAAAAIPEPAGLGALLLTGGMLLRSRKARH